MAKNEPLLDDLYEMKTYARCILSAIALISSLIIFVGPAEISFFKGIAMVITPLCMGLLISPHLAIWRRRDKHEESAIQTETD